MDAVDRSDRRVMHSMYRGDRRSNEVDAHHEVKQNHCCCQYVHGNGAAYWTAH